MLKVVLCLQPASLQPPTRASSGPSDLEPGDWEARSEGQESLEVAHREGRVLKPVPGAGQRAARDLGDRGGRTAAVLGSSSSEHGAVSVRVASLSPGGCAGLCGPLLLERVQPERSLERPPTLRLPVADDKWSVGESVGLQPQSSFCSTSASCILAPHRDSLREWKEN